MGGDSEYGKCQICGTEGPVARKYYYYKLKCECHSPEHFEIVWHCDKCEAKEPIVTKITIKTKNLNELL